MRTPTYDVPSADDPKSVVREGWNRVSTIYRPSGSPADAFGHTLQHHREWLEPLFRRLRRGSEVLDLGCGCGIPDARLLAERFRVTGVDISDVQIARARRLVPQARFVRADMTEIALPGGAFGGVVCLYALIHVPLEEQPGLLGKVARWLSPGGLFLVTTGWTAFTGTEQGWLGSTAKMYWSHADATTYQRWLEELGFRVLRRDRVPEGEEAHALFLAQLGDEPR
ncbi:MAG TPA: class I SAM-dependent methyltransferase [Thermoplasmata archaeon]|jgi:ubiquinone/menaquinone biosynthesis C-methylase UbiE|nr:class I SAM-dependent methyltransferase [Thermoplasmata archaeon]